MWMTKDITSANNDFSAVISIIENAKGRALKAVNAELINMYGKLANICQNYALNRNPQ